MNDVQQKAFLAEIEAEVRAVKCDRFEPCGLPAMLTSMNGMPPSEAIRYRHPPYLQNRMGLSKEEFDGLVKRFRLQPHDCIHYLDEFYTVQERVWRARSIERTAHHPASSSAAVPATRTSLTGVLSSTSAAAMTTTTATATSTATTAAATAAMIPPVPGLMPRAQLIELTELHAMGWDLLRAEDLSTDFKFSIKRERKLDLGLRPTTTAHTTRRKRAWQFQPTPDPLFRADISEVHTRDSHGQFQTSYEAEIEITTFADVFPMKNEDILVRLNFVLYKTFEASKYTLFSSSGWVLYRQPDLLDRIAKALSPEQTRSALPASILPPTTTTTDANPTITEATSSPNMNIEQSPAAPKDAGMDALIVPLRLISITRDPYWLQPSVVRSAAAAATAAASASAAATSSTAPTLPS